MADEAVKASSVSLEYIRALALETGATAEQIRWIIDLVGTDRGSILREVRYLPNLSKPK